ncbi:MAG: hypothetical protein JST36_07550 [Bacteroidetes bacterium]|nr:hypothetical protein [Bacteroidota bacterium]
METPINQTAAVAVTGQAVDPTNGTISGTVNAINNFDVSADLEITISNTSADTDLTNFNLFSGGGIIMALPANTTVTSPFASFSDLQNYVAAVPIQVSGMQVDTNDPTNNYNGNIKVSEIRPNNTLATRTIRFGDYRLSNGGGDYQNVLNVNDGKERMTLGPSTRFTISKLKFGTSITLRLTVPANGRVYEMAAVKY